MGDDSVTADDAPGQLAALEADPAAYAAVDRDTFDPRAVDSCCEHRMRWKQAGSVPLPVSDGVVTVRRFNGDSDRQVIVDGRDDESRRWLGPGSRDPAPTACIDVDGTLVGWIDVDTDRRWLQPGEGNVGYCIFPIHRGHGYAARAVNLLPTILEEQGLRWGLLVIDLANAASLGVARASGARVRPERSIAELPNSAVYAVELS